MVVNRNIVHLSNRNMGESSVFYFYHSGSSWEDSSC